MARDPGDRYADLGAFREALAPFAMTTSTTASPWKRVGAWFLDDAPPPRANDERLRDRKADDPPELIAVLSGGSEGERFAYVYDELSELPSGVIRHEDGKTTFCGAALLEALRERVAILPEG